MQQNDGLYLMMARFGIQKGREFLVLCVSPTFRLGTSHGMYTNIHRQLGPDAVAEHLHSPRTFYPCRETSAAFRGGGRGQEISSHCVAHACSIMYANRLRTDDFCARAPRPPLSVLASLSCCPSMTSFLRCFFAGSFQLPSETECWLHWPCVFVQA